MLISWTSIISALGLCLLLLASGSRADVGRLVCHYEEESLFRERPSPLSLDDLESALNFCNILVYGYLSIDGETYQVKRLDHRTTLHFQEMSKMKAKFPHVRYLLSVGGNRDTKYDGHPDVAKYLTLLEDQGHRNSFKSSLIAEMKRLDFDGINIAWQFPQNPPKVERNVLNKAWHTVKGWFRNTPIDSQAEQHKEQFLTLMRELRRELQSMGKMLALTMIPHVDAELFIDIDAMVDQVDFVSLATYDFQTPLRNTQVADLPAPLYHMYDRDPKHNVDYQVQYWLNNTLNPKKLIIGIPAYGLAWRMTLDSGITGYPPIAATDGPVPPNNYTSIPGQFPWSWTCELLQLYETQTYQDDGLKPGLRKVGDPTKRFGIYAYRAFDNNGVIGKWVGYEDPSTVAIKASYARALGLGGVALHDLSFDDFRGECAGEKYPILRSIKYKL